MRTYTDLNDSELSITACQGDVEAYEEVVRRHGKKIYILAYITSRDNTAAQQLMTRSISKTWHHRSKIKAKDKMLNLLLKEIWGSAVSSNLNGADRAGKPDRPDIAVTDVQEILQNTPGQMLNHRALVVEEALSRMGAEERTVFLLSYAARLDIQEMISYGFTSESQVERKRSEALQRINIHAEKQKETISEAFLKQHFRKDHEALLSISEIELERGVQQGLDEAKTGKMAKRSISNRLIWSVAAGLVGLFLLGSIYQAAPEKPQEMETFDQSYWERTLKEDPISQQRLAEGDFVKIGKVLPEQNGLRLYVDGAMQTSDGLMLWYRLENTEGAAAPIPDRVILWSDVYREVGSEFDRDNMRMWGDGNRTFGKILLSKHQMSSGTSLSSEHTIVFPANVQEDDTDTYRWASFEVPVPDFEEKPVKHIEINQTFEIQDRSIHIDELRLTTDATIVQLGADSSTIITMDQLNLPLLSVIEKSLMSMTGEGKDWIEGFGNETEWYFDSMYYDDYSEIRLSFHSISGMGEQANPVIEVNTDTGEIVEAPEVYDGEIEITDVASDAFFYIFFPSSEESSYTLDYQYSDAEGVSYFAQGIDQVGGRLAYKVTDYDYAQPLTFQIEKLVSGDENAYIDNGDAINLTLVKK
ncbi:sigma-70 family RNA polymerase sigma factor [Paenibacillus urinalis]|uniref:Sigma-70 family RNA polymerase sigma factor n=1 Tax=Paenibacillus urinalis TaxID=521520 RepID=A0ABY7XAF3_9BACL|nr:MULTISPECIES: sigma-70 family RNA polymerase sigma factor [Paenibacillus]WDH99089.1 sigma-70 family RNA polymerase sigma factor [Paenibacillus urinalis]WDI02779.1 sigma-70 family RNA polymerase sigma factor [Paenibacillus urinalis]